MHVLPVRVDRTAKGDRVTEQWRAFVGWWCDGDPEAAWLDLRGSWTEAHAAILDRYELWLNDDCPPCVANAASQIDNLRNLQPEQEWEGEVEGDDYLITRNMVEVTG